MSQRMSYLGKRQRGRVWIGLFLVVCVGFLIYFVAAQQPPLNQAEKEFVGKWTNQTTGMVIAFNSDRSFRSQDGEFVGKWWIENSDLNLKMWRAEPDHFGNKYADFFANPIANLQDYWNAKPVVVSIMQNDEKVQATLSSPGAEEVTIRRIR